MCCFAHSFECHLLSAIRRQRILPSLVEIFRRWCWSLTSISLFAICSYGKALLEHFLRLAATWLSVTRRPKPITLCNIKKRTPITVAIFRSREKKRSRFQNLIPLRTAFLLLLFPTTYAIFLNSSTAKTFLCVFSLIWTRPMILSLLFRVEQSYLSSPSLCIVRSEFFFSSRKSIQILKDDPVNENPPRVSSRVAGRNRRDCARSHAFQRQGKFFDDRCRWHTLLIPCRMTISSSASSSSLSIFRWNNNNGNIR